MNVADAFSNWITSLEQKKWIKSVTLINYGIGWKIEEYHRHIKQQYRLEDVQLKTFDGLQSMFATLTVAMYMIYKKMKSLHFSLLLDVGYNYLNKHKIRELTNFIYYKISKIVSILLMPTKSRWKILKKPPLDHSGQLNLLFNKKTGDG